MANDKKKAKADTEKKNGNSKEAEMSVEVKHYTEVCEALAEKLPEKFRAHAKSASPYLARAWLFVLFAMPYLIAAFLKTKAFISKLPEKIIWACVGFLVCFFGGIFPATIAAAEAWRMCGGTEAWAQVTVLFQEFMKVQDASKEDDAKDEDKNGKKDTAEMTSNQLVQHKVLLAMRVLDPERCSSALTCLYTGWIGVLAILKIKFARTITLGEVIGEAIHKPVSRVEPSIKALVPEEYQKWVPVVCRWTCKFVAVSIAWFLTRVIAAFHSAIRGGQIFGMYLVDFLHERGYLREEHRNSYIDEAIGWAVAALGFLTQMAFGFHLPFLLNLVLWPVQLMEAFVVYSVSF